MVASSSNLLLVAASTTQGHVRTGSTIPNDHDLTMTNFSNENRRGYLIRSTSTNNISGISGTNLKDMIMLETVAPAYASATSTSAASASTMPPSATKSEEKPRPRPHRKKMVSTGVDAMKKMLVTSSSVVVALPESPTLMVSRKHECDDMEGIFNNIRSTSSIRKVLSFSMETPSMPDMMPDMMMSMPALPTPAVNRSSKQKNERSNNAPMKKKKHHHPLGRRLRQMKKRLTLASKSKSTTSSSSSKTEKEEVVCLSPVGTSATTSTSSFGPTSSLQEEEDDLPFMDTMDIMMTMNMTTSLKPRIRSMFHEDEEDRMMMMPLMMPVLPAPPCPLSLSLSLSSTEDVVTTTPTPSASFSSKLDKALWVFSPNDGDDGDDDDAGADDTADDWGVFTSDDNDDDDEEEDHHHDDIVEPKYNNSNSKPFSRSSFTKTATTHPCFQPCAHLPVFAATAGAE